MEEKVLYGAMTHEMTTVNRLADRMRDKHATIERLALAAGVSKSTVLSARKGNLVHTSIAASINEALETRKFSYLHEGKAGTGMINMPQNHDANSINVRSSCLKYYKEGDDPDITHSITPAASHGRILYRPIAKTEEEIDRMWEYNRMMGRK